MYDRMPASSLRQPRVAPVRSNPTDQLFYSWEHVPSEQQESILALVEASRADVARARRRRLTIGLLILAGLAAAVLMYLLLAMPS